MQSALHTSVQRLCLVGSLAVSLLVLVGCAHSPNSSAGLNRGQSGVEDRIQSLTGALRGLAPGVDAHEARSIAGTAVNYSLRQAETYRAVRPAFVHNIMVNMNLRDRGLCHHWADDLQSQLTLCISGTLRLYRVVSGKNTPREHNAVVVAAKLSPMTEGLLLDGWRHGGRLYWVRVTEDRKYQWTLRQDLPWIGEQIEPKSSIDPAGVTH